MLIKGYDKKKIGKPQTGSTLTWKSHSFSN